MSKPTSSNMKLVFGAPPRADLLPPEVEQRAKARSLRRTLGAVIVLTMVLVIVGYGAVSLLSITSQAQLDQANARTSQLLAEQAKYIEVRKVSNTLQTAVAARQVGSSTEIIWKEYLTEIQGSLPAGTIVTNFAAETETPIATYTPPSVPLQGERIGQLTFTATSASLPDVEAWLRALATLTGYVDAAPGSVTLKEDGTYTVAIVMHINSDALANRFAEATDGKD